MGFVENSVTTSGVLASGPRTKSLFDGIRVFVLALFVLSACDWGTGSRTCCKYCDPQKSDPCGDTCIANGNTCHSGQGCACYK